MEKFYEDFIISYMKKAPYADGYEVSKVVSDLRDILVNNKDASIDEILISIMSDLDFKVNRVSNSAITRGGILHFHTPSFNIKSITGTNRSKDELPSDSIFDIASMSKYYTLIIAYYLIEKELFDMDDCIYDLDNRFINLGDITVRDILSFTTEFITDNRVDSHSTTKEALNEIYHVWPVRKEVFNYNDIGMIIMKEVMEKVTGKSFEELFNIYIVGKYNLADTYLHLNDNNIMRFTGSANDELGLTNDSKAIVLGGVSGHAGVKATSDDVLKLSRSLFKNKETPRSLLYDSYTSGISYNRGITGYTHTPNSNGTSDGLISSLSPKRHFAIQGSTRVYSEFGEDYQFGIFFNPASCDFDMALYLQEKINFERRKAGLLDAMIAKTYIVNEKEYKLVDPRLLFKIDEFGELIKECSKVCIMLKLLNDLDNDLSIKRTRRI